MNAFAFHAGSVSATMPDEIPFWFGIVAAILLWAALIVVTIRSAAPDPDPESLTGLDVLERTGVHPG